MCNEELLGLLARNTHPVLRELTFYRRSRTSELLFSLVDAVRWVCMKCCGDLGKKHLLLPGEARQALWRGCGLWSWPWGARHLHREGGGVRNMDLRPREGRGLSWSVEARSITCPISWFIFPTIYHVTLDVPTRTRHHPPLIHFTSSLLKHA